MQGECNESEVAVEAATQHPDGTHLERLAPKQLAHKALDGIKVLLLLRSRH